MINVKQIYVEFAPVSKFQKYTVGMTVDVSYESEDELTESVRKVQTMCRKLSNEQIALDLK